MAELKTKKNKASVSKYLNSIEDKSRRADSKEVSKIIQEISGEKPSMWGESIVGFGDYHYTYASGREGDWMRMGFSSRKNAISLYLMCDLDTVEGLLTKLGKHKRGRGCLYIQSLEDIHLPTLKKLIKTSYKAGK